MKSLLDPDVRNSLMQRVTKLRPDTPARWGQFSAPQMLAHVIQSLGMMTGDVAVAAAPTPWAVRHAPLKHLLIYVIPFPKGLPTSPELLQRPDAGARASHGAWDAELRGFTQALDRIPEVARTGKWPLHPAFGPLSGAEWGVQQHRHLEHHFRQFGL